MSDDIGGTRYGGKPGEDVFKRPLPDAIQRKYDGDNNKISIYNGPDLSIPARGIVPYDPEPDQVTLTSMAHAMGFTARFAGHTRYFYSVAQHSLYVAAHAPHNLRLKALLHDASEAYLTDIPSPYKMQIPGYKETERKVTAAIGAHFGIDNLADKDPIIKALDIQALGHEANSFMPTNGDWYGPYYRQAIADTAHMEPIKTFERRPWMQEEDAIAESMKQAAYAIREYENAVKYEIYQAEGKIDGYTALRAAVEGTYTRILNNINY